LAVASRAELGAEVLFLRKELAFYAMVSAIQLESGIGGRQTGDPSRWHRKGFELFWRWKSRLGRPADCTRISAGEARRVRSNALSSDYNCKIIFLCLNFTEVVLNFRA
jgi:hypothetical protein